MPQEDDHDILKDPSVKERLAEGRTPDDIAVLSCPNCGEYGYYNEGSSFYCRFCDVGFYVCDDNETPPLGPHMFLDSATTLADLSSIEEVEI